MIDLTKLLRPNILSLKPYRSARTEFSEEAQVFLDANENPFGTLNRYPDTDQSQLKATLSVIKGVEEDMVFIGNGSDEVIDLIFRLFCRPGQDKVLQFLPTYGMYEVSAGVNDVAVLSEALDSQFQIDFSVMEPLLKDELLKVIFICSPNNPTGNLIELNTIETLLKRFKGIVVVDEAYIDFAESESCLNLIQTYNNLIVCQTLSKAWGLAGARIGMAFAQPDIIRYFNHIKPPYNVSSLNQKAAIEALNEGGMAANLSLILEEKERISQTLVQFPTVKKVFPSVANFLLVEFDDANQVYQYLIKHGIVVRNRHTQIRQCLRISVGTKEENTKLLTALRNYT